MTTRKKRADFTLQEWTEHQRALERGYDAKRRAKQKAEGQRLTSDERRARREATLKRANPPSSHHAFDTVIAAMQALDIAASQREQPASGSLAELEDHLKQRLAHLRATIPQ